MESFRVCGVEGALDFCLSPTAWGLGVLAF